jgi:predicted nucleotidyltransferase
MTMTHIDHILHGITETFRANGADKVILFGSYASGTPDENSDLDLIVVTTDNFMPTTNREKMELHHRFNRLIRHYRKEIPIDMLVYTKPMYEKLLETGSLFSTEIIRKGKVLYEATNQGVA